MVVAFSGGVDSAVLARAAVDALGPDRVWAVTARSASLATGELDHCRDLAASWGMRWTSVDTTELDRPEYVANGGDRCFWCKDALDGRSVADRCGGGCLRRPGGQRGRPGRPSAWPGCGSGPGRTVPPGRGRPAQGRHPRPGPGPRAVGVGPAGQSLPVVPHPVRHPGDRPGVVAHRSRRRPPSGPQGSATSGCATTATPHGSRSRSTSWAPRPTRAPELVAALEAIGYRYVTLDLAGLRSGNLNAALTDPALVDPALADEA